MTNILTESYILHIQVPQVLSLMTLPGSGMVMLDTVSEITESPKSCWLILTTPGWTLLQTKVLAYTKSNYKLHDFYVS